MNPKCGVVILVIMEACLLFAACTRNESGEPAAVARTSQTAPASPEVQVVRVVSQQLNTTVHLPGQLAAYETVDVYAKVTGFVKTIKVDRGSRVKAGEQIALLEAPELLARRAEAELKFQSAESQLAAGQAKLASDRATFQRLGNAAKTPGVVAQNDLEVAEKTAQADQANVESLEKSAKAAQEALRAVAQLEAYLTITAPFDGQVTTRNVHPGALVGPAGGAGAITPIVQIQPLTRHRLVVPVPEYDASGIPAGTPVNFSVPSFPGKTFTAPITRISGAVDIKTRTMPVELDVQDPKAQLEPGTYCDVAWPVRRAYSTLFVPPSAVANDLERTFVIRIHNHQAEWVDVKTGAASGNLVEVFGNLQEGDEVVQRGTDELRAGTSVTPQLVQPK